MNISSRSFVLSLLALAGAAMAAESAPVRLNGLMVDAARAPESVEYYRRMIDFCADWGLNALLFRVADDQGTAVRFASHPELITHADALTPAQVRELAAYAQQRHIELIPEIESFGHTGFITRVPQYASLGDARPGAGQFRGLIPVDPRAVALLTDLYREAATMFSSPYLHIGCDKVNWGGSDLSQAALKTKSRAMIWAEYLNKLDAAARSFNKQAIVWGDHVLQKEPEILTYLNKDVIILDWDYGVTDQAIIEKRTRQALDAGFRVAGGPAWDYCRWGPRAGSSQLRNIDAYADVYRRINDPRALGVIVTNWVPTRYLQGAIWDGMAYAAVDVTEGSAAAKDSALRRFVEKYYGAMWNDAWADIFQTYYDNTPQRRSCSSGRQGPLLQAPWASDDDLRRVFVAQPVTAPPFTRLLSQMAMVEPAVRKHYEDFRAFRLSAEYLEQVFWRDGAIVEAAGKIAHPEDAQPLLETIAQRDRRIYDALDREWNQGRAPNSPMKTEQLDSLRPEDQLLMRFHQATDYSTRLAEHPDHLHEVVETKSAAGQQQR